MSLAALLVSLGVLLVSLRGLLVSLGVLLVNSADFGYKWLYKKFLDKRCVVGKPLK
ncbi:hypothetical protein ACWF5S_09890 [Peribacillus butanolivorans]